MADKPEFVDLISDATRQNRRNASRIVDLTPAQQAKNTRRMSNWPPEHWQEWRMVALTPWKIKPWKGKDWD